MQHFFGDETGAVTVDWVVLTAALVGLGLATMSVVSGGAENLSNDTARQLALMEVSQNPFTLLPGFDIAGFTHAIDDGLAERTHAEYLRDTYSDEDVETVLAGFHTSLTGGTASHSDTDVDQYAGVYAAAEDRGIYTGSYTDPGAFSDIYHEANS